MNKLKFLLGFAAMAVLVSCGDKSGSIKADQFLESYVAEHASVVAYGSFDYKGIINKSDAQNIPEFGSFITQTLDSFTLAFPDDARIYFLVENADSTDGNPADLGVFTIDVKDKEQLMGEFTKMGYSNVSEDEKQVLYVNDNMLVSIQEKLAVVFVQEKSFDAPKEFVKAFFEKNKGKSENDIAGEVLEDGGDIVFCSRPESMYAEQVSKAKGVSEAQKSLTMSYIKDAQFKTSVHFKDGEGVITTKAFVNDKLREALFFNTEGNEAILNQMGPMDANMGLCMNLDMDKLEKLVKELDPNIMNKMFSNVDGAPMILGVLNTQKFSAFINGKLAVVSSGIASKSDSIKDISAYVGLGKGAKGLIDFATSMSDSKDLQKVGENLYSLGGEALVKQGDDYLLVKKSSGTKLAEGKVNIPDWADGFGEKPVTGFINIAAIPESALVELNLDDTEFALDALEWAYFESDNLESKFVLKAKKGQENILKQILESFMESRF